MGKELDVVKALIEVKALDVVKALNVVKGLKVLYGKSLDIVDAIPFKRRAVKESAAFWSNYSHVGQWN